MTGRAPRIAILGVLTALAACTGASPRGGAPSSPIVPSAATSDAPVLPPAGSGNGSALRALHRLCTVPALIEGPPARRRGPVPPFVQVVERIAAARRGLEFVHEVPVDVLTDAELDARLREILDASISDEQLARRTQAWATIGVIPPEADLERALRSYLAGQVLGFYVPETDELVYAGSGDPSLIEGVVLAHELTHALDDQHFDLVRVDRLAAGCRDERSMAALGAVEGSAQYVATSAIPDLQPFADGVGSVDTGGGAPEVVPPFVRSLQQWPYVAGIGFVQHRFAAGGAEAVNEAMRNLPVSTEQILHPERYPGDAPQPIDVPNLAPAFGPGWRDLDVMEIGEAWLRLALSLRLEDEVAERASSGWDGGIYRAWTDGEQTAVLVRTTWDTPEDAAEFATAMRAWIEEGSATAETLAPAGSTADVAIGSDALTLQTLRSAIG